MKLKTKYLQIYPLAVMGAFLFFFTSCKKDVESEYGPQSGTLTDIDGNVYQTVMIGKQEWMAENLKVTRYNDGTSIGYPETDNSAWENNTKGAYTWYNNDEATYGETYGALYNWHAVNAGKLCPAGWNVPTDEQWTQMNKYLVTNPGGKLKETGTRHWPGINMGANNESGFTALPAGVRFAARPKGSGVTHNGHFYYIGQTGRWWSSTEYSSTSAWYRSIYYNSSNIYRSYNNKETGFSVRCVRNLK